MGEVRAFDRLVESLGVAFDEIEALLANEAFEDREVVVGKANVGKGGRNPRGEPFSDHDDLMAAFMEFVGEAVAGRARSVADGVSAFEYKDDFHGDLS